MANDSYIKLQYNSADSLPTNLNRYIGNVPEDIIFTNDLGASEIEAMTPEERENFIKEYDVYCPPYIKSKRNGKE